MSTAPPFHLTRIVSCASWLRIKALTASRTTFAFAAVMIAAGVLAGCRAEEQGRPLVIKGTYRGRADTALSEAKLNELKDRVSLQSSTLGGTGAGIVERPGVERPAPSSKSLNERLRLQDAPPNIPSKSSSARRPHEPLPDIAKAAPSDKALDKALNERLKLQEGPPDVPKSSDVSTPQKPATGTATTAPAAPAPTTASSAPAASASDNQPHN
jgi:hypothetical protein